MLVSTWYDDMHNGGLIEYVLKVFPSFDEVIFIYYVDVWSVKASGLIISLLSMCEVIGLHRYIPVLDLDWVCE